MFDLIIRNGAVIDGSGAARARAPTSALSVNAFMPSATWRPSRPAGRSTRPA